MKEENHICETCYWYEPDADGWGFCDKKGAYTREDCRCPDCITLKPVPIWGLIPEEKEGEKNGI